MVKKGIEAASKMLEVLYLMGLIMGTLKPEESKLKKENLDFEESKVMIILNLAQTEVGTKTSRANDSITFKDINFHIYSNLLH
jgi:transcriptional regulator of heat shock response